MTIPKYILLHLKPREVLQKEVGLIKNNISRLHATAPEVSVIIPAFNEEEGILQTLSSLSASTTGKSVEIIVVDNRSTDATGELAAAAGATCIAEHQQGITSARNAGLRIARGKYILNADADTLYPPGWIDLMLQPLYTPETGMVYGRHAFIATRRTPRIIYFLYEYAADLSRWINATFREEAVNVYGFNSAFRKEEGISVSGFDHPPGTNEDGWLAVKLRRTFGKKPYQVKDAGAMVWTTDRRIQAEGGLLKGMLKRVRRHLR